MSSDAWKDREKAAEDKFFDQQNRDALKRLQEKRELKSPVSGEPMEQVSVMGINVDRCKQSGGVWLDAGELQEILKAAESNKDHTPGWLHNFVSSLFPKK